MEVELFDRNSIGSLPVVQYRTAVLRSVLLKQAAAVIFFLVMCVALSPSILMGAVPVVACLLGWALMHIAIRLHHRSLGRKTTEVMLRHGSELVGPNALPDVHAALDDFTEMVGCERPRFFMVAEVIENMSPAIAWKCGGRYCVALSDVVVQQLPYLMRYILSHEFAHFLLDELRIRRGVIVGNSLVLSTALMTVLWSFITMTWAVGNGVSVWWFLAHQFVFFLSCGVALIFWFRVSSWISEVMHAGEYAADAVGAAMIGSRSQMAGALTEMEIEFRGIAGLSHSSDSHPSIRARVRALYEL